MSCAFSSDEDKGCHDMLHKGKLPRGSNRKRGRESTYPQPATPMDPYTSSTFTLKNAVSFQRNTFIYHIQLW